MFPIVVPSAVGLHVCKCGIVDGAHISSGAVCGTLCCGVGNAVLNVSANFLSASICSTPTFKNGVADLG